MQLQVERGSFKTLITLFAEMLIQIQRAADQIERQIFETAQCDRTFWSQVELLTSIPGIGQYAAVVILAEIGDFSRFKKAKQLVCLCRYRPRREAIWHERIQAQQNQQARFPLPEKDTGYLHTRCGP